MERRHPDVFTAAEALAYLGKNADSGNTLATLREKHGLRGFYIGQEMFYHRRHLDALVLRLAGIDADTQVPANRTGHGSLKIGAR